MGKDHATGGRIRSPRKGPATIVTTIDDVATVLCCLASTDAGRTRSPRKGPAKLLANTPTSRHHSVDTDDGHITICRSTPSTVTRQHELAVAADDNTTVAGLLVAVATPTPTTRRPPRPLSLDHLSSAVPRPLGTCPTDI
jgi:hypothetical protein